MGTVRFFVTCCRGAAIRILIAAALMGAAFTGWSQPYGLNGRVANTTLRLPADPPSYSFVTVDALNGLPFSNPVTIATPPGETNQLFIVERAGRIIAITNLAAPNRTVFLDIVSRVNSNYQTQGSEGLTGLAFHPNYAANGLFYVTYSLNTTTAAGTGLHNRLARFQRSSNDPFFVPSSSEVPLITQRDEGIGHSMNDLLFDRDGYLIMSVGDEGDGGTGDDWNNAQRIDKDYFSAILRIDVDKRPGSLPPNPHPASTSNYAVPSDNPFIGLTSFNGIPVNPSNIRTEFYAIGFRNPWKLWLDRATGLLYCGDVGQHKNDEINVVFKGGNYGWSFFEGTSNGPKGPPPAGFSKIDPIYQYSPGYGPFNGTTVIGGLVYRGQKFPELDGAYVFCDYTSGNIWSFRTDGWSISNLQRLTGDAGIAAFGLDPRNGDILMADHDEGKIKRLDRVIASGTPFPATLADTGVFSDVGALAPNPGVVAYDLNVPFWSDGAQKRRWFCVPDLNARMMFGREGNWSFPTGTVWVKHFDLELIRGNPASSRRIETRVLVKTAASVYGVTYRWRPSMDNADLVPEEGIDESFAINDGGIMRTQVWHYPSRNECLSCHTAGGGYALGFNSAQLNRAFDYGGTVDNQLRALEHAGYFANPVTDPVTIRMLAAATNTIFSREYRVRSYLAANCAQCHQPGSVAGVSWDARIGTPLSEAGIINGSLHDSGGDGANRVVVPGDSAHSMVLKRIGNFAPVRHMPPLATSVLNQEAIDLVTQWITMDLAGYETFDQWRTRLFGSNTSGEGAPDADPDGDGAVNRLEYLLHRDPTNSSDGWRIELERAGAVVNVSYPRVANRGFEVQATDSLEWPVSWRTLNFPGNEPIISSTDDRVSVQDPSPPPPGGKYYRVRVFEP